MPEALSVARRLSKAPERYVAGTAAAEVTRELSGRGVALHPGSRIRYLLVDGGGKKKASGAARGGGKQHGRAAGFLDGSESPDLSRYEAILREAAGEALALLGPLDGARYPAPQTGRKPPPMCGRIIRKQRKSPLCGNGEGHV